MTVRRKFATVFCASVIALAATASASAEESTAVQRAACKPDVYRLCKWYIPSHSAITYCLRKNLDQLSPDCRAVMEGRLR